MLPATAAEMIALLCQPGMESAWRNERRSDSSVHAGFAAHGGDGYDFMATLPRSWRIVPEWGDWPYLIAWRNDRDHAVVTYCEGDLSVEVADSSSSYHQLLACTTRELTLEPEDCERYLALLAARGSSPLSPGA